MARIRRSYGRRGRQGDQTPEILRRELQRKVEADNSRDPDVTQQCALEPPARAWWLEREDD